MNQLLKRSFARNLIGRGLSSFKSTSSSLQPPPHYNIYSSTSLSEHLNKSYSLPPLPSASNLAILDKPDFSKHVKIDIPFIPQVEKIDKLNELHNVKIEEPQVIHQITEKHAIVMINKRRRKMKKHKLKKLRIRMKFEWAKVRQRRELKKEKAFQIELSSKIKEGERFNAEQYVEKKINLLHAEHLADRWKKAPEWFVREQLEKKSQAQSARKALKDRRKALHSTYVKDWDV